MTPHPRWRALLRGRYGEGLGASGGKAGCKVLLWGSKLVKDAMGKMQSPTRGSPWECDKSTLE